MTKKKKKGRKVVNLCPDSCIKYHSKDEVAKILGVSERQLYNLKEKGLHLGLRGGAKCEDIRNFVYKRQPEMKLAS